MARVIEIKCPKCSAPLPIDADAQTVTCRYCGGTSVIERPGQSGQGAPQRPPGPAPAAHASVAKVLVGIGVVVMALGGLVSVLVLGSGHAPPQGAPELQAAVAIATPTASYRFNDRPMLADINGDGAPDVIGRVSDFKIGTWIGAFDGTTGAELWRSELLTKDASEGSTLRGVAHGRVVSIDALGKVQAYDLKTGGPLWSGLLGEQAREICEGEGVIIIGTADDARHALDPIGGKPRQLAKGAACVPVFSSERDVAPGYRIIGWSDFDEYRLPGLHDIDGLAAHRALVPSGPGPRFMLGSKSTGTSVAMVAAIGDKRKREWMDVVPGVDPLTTEVNVTTQDAAFSAGVLVVPYSMKDHAGGMRMAAFDAATGARLWDVEALPSPQVSNGMAVSSERVFFSSWSQVVVLSLKTGEKQFTLGTG